ncbi:MAG: cyclic-di-AMP receptor [Tissierellia bacterium]|nr:cyclic-di-AMP receptor [Tissierellia bacterium]
MEMLVAIVAADRVKGLVDGLVAKKIPVTEISSEGGFLKKGNTTLVMGIEEGDKEALEAVFQREVAGKNPGQGHGGHLFYLDLEDGFRI